MGTWGTGLYANDFAEDFKDSIKAVAKLPLNPAELVELLRQSNVDIADNPQDEDHTAFWLVLADQFHKRGIDVPSLFQRAYQIIDSGADLEMVASLGMSDSDLKKRKKMLEGLKAALSLPVPDKARKTISGPEPFLLNVGDLVVYPVSSSGYPPNPYMSQAMIAEHWDHSGWGAMVIAACGRAFGYLAWYWPIVLEKAKPLSKKPDAASLLLEKKWQVSLPGTCSKSHFKKMQLETVRSVSISEAKVRRLLKDVANADEYAMNDISIANAIDIRGDRRFQNVAGIEALSS